MPINAHPQQSAYRPTQLSKPRKVSIQGESIKVQSHNNELNIKKIYRLGLGPTRLCTKALICSAEAQQIKKQAQPKSLLTLIYLANASVAAIYSYPKSRATAS